MRPAMSATFTQWFSMWMAQQTHHTIYARASRIVASGPRLWTTHKGRGLVALAPHLMLFGDQKLRKIKLTILFMIWGIGRKKNLPSSVLLLLWPGEVRRKREDDSGQTGPALFAGSNKTELGNFFFCRCPILCALVCHPNLTTKVKKLWQWS